MGICFRTILFLCLVCVSLRPGSSDSFESTDTDENEQPPLETADDFDVEQSSQVVDSDESEKEEDIDKNGDGDTDPEEISENQDSDEENLLPQQYNDPGSSRYQQPLPLRHKLPQQYANAAHYTRRARGINKNPFNNLIDQGSFGYSSKNSLNNGLSQGFPSDSGFEDSNPTAQSPANAYKTFLEKFNNGDAGKTPFGSGNNYGKTAGVQSGTAGYGLYNNQRTSQRSYLRSSPTGGAQYLRGNAGNNLATSLQNPSLYTRGNNGLGNQINNQQAKARFGLAGYRQGNAGIARNNQYNLLGGTVRNSQGFRPNYGNRLNTAGSVNGNQMYSKVGSRYNAQSPRSMYPTHLYQTARHAQFKQPMYRRGNGFGITQASEPYGRTQSPVDILRHLTHQTNTGHSYNPENDPLARIETPLSGNSMPPGNSFLASSLAGNSIHTANAIRYRQPTGRQAYPNNLQSSPQNVISNSQSAPYQGSLSAPNTNQIYLGQYNTDTGAKLPTKVDEYLYVDNLVFR